MNKYKQLRLKRDLSVSQASKLLDISESHLWNIERDIRHPGKELMRKMTKIYKCKLEEIFFA